MCRFSFPLGSHYVFVTRITYKTTVEGDHIDLPQQRGYCEAVVVENITSTKCLGMLGSDQVDSPKSCGME